MIEQRLPFTDIEVAKGGRVGFLAGGGDPNRMGQIHTFFVFEHGFLARSKA